MNPRDVERLLADREAQGHGRTIEDPTALRRIANVVAKARPVGRKTKPKDAA